VALGNPEAALADCVQSIRLEPNLAKSYLDWAIGNTVPGKYDQVLIGCDAILQTNPNSGNALVLRSNAHAMLGNWDQANADYARVVAGGTKSMSALAMEAMCLLAKGDEAGYRRICADALKRFRNSVDLDAVYLLARVGSMAETPGIAPADAIPLAERGARDPQGWRLHTLGLAHYRAGQFEQAHDRLRESEATNWRGNANNWLVQAMVFHHLGNPTEARRRLNRAIQNPVPYIHPHEGVAYRILRRQAEALLGVEGGRP
jgi:tetratricopeptide (TPR) repeat protein